MPKGVKTAKGPKYPYPDSKQARDGARVSLAEVKVGVDAYLHSYAQLVRLPLTRPVERKAAWEDYLRHRFALAAKLRHWGLKVVHRGLAFEAPAVDRDIAIQPFTEAEEGGGAA